MPYDIVQLTDMILPELRDVAERLTIPDHGGMDKQTLIYKIIDHQAARSAAGEDRADAAEQPAKKRPGRPKKAAASAEGDGEAPKKRTARKKAAPDAEATPEQSAESQSGEVGAEWAQLSRNQEAGEVQPTPDPRPAEGTP